MPLDNALASNRVVALHHPDSPMTRLNDVRLHPSDIEQIADRVAELLRDGSPTSQVRFVDAATLATTLGVDRAWVYEHADELGALRLGGPRGRLRFDMDNVRARLEPADRPPVARGPRGRTRRHPVPRPVDLLRLEA